MDKITLINTFKPKCNSIHNISIMVNK